MPEIRNISCFPLSPDDDSLAYPTCRLSLEHASQLQCKPGDWVEVSMKQAKYLCRVWPIPGSKRHFLQMSTCHVQSGSIPWMNGAVASVAPLSPSEIVDALQVTVHVREGQFSQSLLQIQMMLQEFLLHWVLFEKTTLSLSELSSLPYLSTDLSLVFPAGPTQYHRITDATQFDVRLLETSSTAHPTSSISFTGTALHAYHRLSDMISFCTDHQAHFRALRVAPPRGILLSGPSGVGKTALVRQVAADHHARLITIDGIALSQSYLGDCEAELRARFQEASLATQSGACLLFLDDLDALCVRRDSLQSSRLVSQLLTLMDGVTSPAANHCPPLLWVAATEHLDAVDPALRRPGRFDREIALSLPSLEERRSLLHALTSTTLSIDDQETMARFTRGYSQADLTLLCREGAWLALKEGASVTLSHLQTAAARRPASSQREHQAMAVQSSATSARIALGGLGGVLRCVEQIVAWPTLYAAAYARLRISTPTGLLLYGPPGCSKTTLVRDMAAQCRATFFYRTSAEVFSAYVGESERMIRSLFHSARQCRPSIVFFDEIDVLVTRRSSSSVTKEQVQERILSTLLNEMDGIEEMRGVLVVGATNRPDLIDEALLRPGRFDRLLYVPAPDALGRIDILMIHMRNKPHHDADMDYAALSAEMEGYSGADIENVCQEAALLAMRQGQTLITMSHLQEARRAIPPSITPVMAAYYDRVSRAMGGRVT